MIEQIEQTKQIVVRLLRHRWLMSDDEFFTQIDLFGGWPVGKKFVSFYHSNERPCEFGNHYLRNEWWTTVASADDYYWWKISKERKEEIIKAAEREAVNRFRDFIRKGGR
jgi:hypothetical protein